MIFPNETIHHKTVVIIDVHIQEWWAYTHTDTHAIIFSETHIARIIIAKTETLSTGLVLCMCRKIHIELELKMKDSCSGKTRSENSVYLKLKGQRSFIQQKCCIHSYYNFWKTHNIEYYCQKFDYFWGHLFTEKL